MKLVKLIPDVGYKYHFGVDGLETVNKYFPSSSLFSAIVNNYVKLYGDEGLNELLNIKLSALFPGVGDVLFIVRPSIQLKFDESVFLKDPKLSKKIEFVSLSVLKENNLGRIDYREGLLVNGFLFSKDDAEKLKDSFPQGLLEVDVEDRVSLSRLNDSSAAGGSFAPFMVSFVYVLDSNLFYYFVYDDSMLSQNVKDKLSSSIRLILDEGLGGERGVGAGIFKDMVVFDNADYFDDYVKSTEGIIADEKYYVSISSVIPANEDEFKKAIFYKITKQAGYVYQDGKLNLRRKEIFELSEGSVFEQPIEGTVVNVSPQNDFNVYRFGRFLGIPCFGGKNGQLAKG